MRRSLSRVAGIGTRLWAGKSRTQISVEARDLYSPK